MPSPGYPVLRCPLPDRVTPIFVQVVSPSLGWSPLPYFLVVSSPSGDFSYIADYIYDFCPVSDPDVGPSVLKCDVEHISFH